MEKLKNKIHKYTRSSADPEKLSATIKGLLVGLVPLGLFVLNQFGLAVSEQTAVNFIDMIARFLATATVLYGLGRKIYKGRWTAKK